MTEVVEDIRARNGLIIMMADVNLDISKSLRLGRNRIQDALFFSSILDTNLHVINPDIDRDLFISEQTSIGNPFTFVRNDHTTSRIDYVLID